MIGYMAIIFAIFYFLVIMPQRRREKERKKLLAALKTGDRIVFSGGMLGSVVNVKDHTVVVKVADNVKIEILRGAVLRILEDDAALGTVDPHAA